VPARVEGHSFQVVANNPGVVDLGQDPNQVPSRSVIITVRDGFGTVISTPSTNGVSVVQNFLTAYGVTFLSNCDKSAAACAGQDSIVRLRAVTNGGLYGNRSFRFCVVRGSFSFVSPEIPSNLPETLSNCFDAVSDHNGNVTARIRVPSGAQTQLATIRVIDVATGAFVDQLFTITAAVTPVTNLTILPNDFQFTGPRQGVCGTGTGSFLVFDGTPPYTSFSSDPNVTVTPASTTSDPGQFTVIANNAAVCVSNATIVITDSASPSRRATVTVSTSEGSSTPPAMTVSPTTVSLGDICGLSVSVSVVGGSGIYAANSTHPRVTAAISGNTVTITRALHDPVPLVAYPNSGTVTVTDGTTLTNVTVNSIAQICP
jgi:hypothetical protein